MSRSQWDRLDEAEGKPDECDRCGHVHRGRSTRESHEDQCGYPWREENPPGSLEAYSMGWCQCYTKPGQMQQTGVRFGEPEPTPEDPRHDRRSQNEGKGSSSSKPQIRPGALVWVVDRLPVWFRSTLTGDHTSWGYLSRDAELEVLEHGLTQRVKLRGLGWNAGLYTACVEDVVKHCRVVRPKSELPTMWERLDLV